MKCPFDAIEIINIPKVLEKDTTHRHGVNTFKLHSYALAINFQEKAIEAWRGLAPIAQDELKEAQLQTAKTRKNPGKRFVTCSKCNVYNFLDDDLPSEYYKELLYGMLQKHKQLKKHVNYEQVINVLAMDKSRLEEELRATQSKMKLYDSVMFGMQMVKFGCCKCKQIVNTLVAASASKWVSKFGCCKWKQMGKQSANACLQMQASIQAVIFMLQFKAANASCNCNLQMLACKCKLKLQVAIVRCK
ncbi:hypothetical protein Tco_0067069 [Tanacetum coccineum]